MAEQMKVEFQFGRALIITGEATKLPFGETAAEKKHRFKMC